MSNLTSERLFTLIQRYRVMMREAINAKKLHLNAMHIQCLTFIAEIRDCTANSIVQGLARDKSQISSLIKEMVNKGWVEKRPNPTDKRSQLLVLSRSGRALLDKVRYEEAAISKHMLQGVSKKELETFHQTLQMMIDNLDSAHKMI